MVNIKLTSQVCFLHFTSTRKLQYYYFRKYLELNISFFMMAVYSIVK